MRKALILLAVLVQVICLAGCSDSTGKLEGYVKDRYGIDIEYDDYHVGTVYRFKDTSGELDHDIYVSYNKLGNKEYYADNVMAVRYYNDAYNKINDTIGEVIENYIVYMDISDSVFVVEDAESYSLSEYLYDENAYKGIHIYVEKLDEVVYNSIIDALQRNNISVRGVVAQIKDLNEVKDLSYNMEERYITNWDNIQKQINFTLSSGELEYSDWIDLGHNDEECNLAESNQDLEKSKFDTDNTSYNFDGSVGETWISDDKNSTKDEYFGMYQDDYDINSNETVDWDKYLEELLGQ